VSVAIDNIAAVDAGLANEFGKALPVRSDIEHH
jgi:hypothetical protein